MVYTLLFSVSATLVIRHKTGFAALVDTAKTVPLRIHAGADARVILFPLTPVIWCFLNLPSLSSRLIVSPAEIYLASTLSTVITLPLFATMRPPKRAPARLLSRISIISPGVK